ncbi:hypothetical protein KY347_07050 [Candidatus Woesearchaeota archaeon]|nr:hypothetical protein [Candidatus Woesearchaeota archaeon]
MGQKKGVMLAVFGVFLLLFIGGCGETEVTGGAPTKPFIGGTQGVVMGFLDGAPPEEVTDGGTFPFQAMVRLKNEGEYNIEKENVKVSIIGISPKDFGVSSADLTNKNPSEGILYGKQRDSEGNVIDSVETYIMFPGGTDNFNFGGSLAGNTQFLFRAEICYKYQTRAVSEICVLRNMIEIPDDAICNPQGDKETLSSGSPIQIASFRQSVIGSGRTLLSFDIVHSGKGRIFDPSTAAYCPSDAMGRRASEDKVEVEIYTGVGGKLTCAGLAESKSGVAGGIVNLINGKRTLTCTQELSKEDMMSDFEKPITITLDFNYLDSVTEVVLVKHLLGDDVSSTPEPETESESSESTQDAPKPVIS